MPQYLTNSQKNNLTYALFPKYENRYMIITFMTIGQNSSATLYMVMFDKTLKNIDRIELGNKAFDM